jgi:hypothetical protein
LLPVKLNHQKLKTLPAHQVMRHIKVKFEVSLGIHFTAFLA